MMTGVRRVLVLLIAAPILVVGAGIAIDALAGPDHGKVTPRSIDASLMRESGGGSALGERPAPCTHRRGPWTCEVPDTAGSGGAAAYRLRMRDEHCWRAVKTRRETDGMPLAVHPSGCVTKDDEDRANRTPPGPPIP
jgi:hypothetical protein